MEIRLQGKQNVYQNIVEEYKRLIGFGAMKYGERLPSVRALALELGSTPTRVERAYLALEEEGLYRILPKKGAYVDFAARRAARSAGGAETSASAFETGGLYRGGIFDAPRRDIFGERGGERAMIEIKRLTKAYDKAPVLRDVNLAVPDKSVFGLVGINGAGKIHSFAADFGRIESGQRNYSDRRRARL